jgi:hypothetical protein
MLLVCIGTSGADLSTVFSATEQDKKASERWFKRCHAKKNPLAND